MRVSILKKEIRYDSRNDRGLGIQTYGEDNDYPQQVMMIVGASSTGTSCVNTYSKFIAGKGFNDVNLYKLLLNSDNETADYILDRASEDFSRFGGFAIHVNYNANYKIVSIKNIPFEHVRFEKLNEAGEFNRVAIHPDWGKQYTQLQKWKKEDISFIHLYNPNPDEIDRQVEEVKGWEHYKGQVYYFSNAGSKTYPTPIYDSTLTDMNTEEGISNVNNRNARNNFLGSAMVINRVMDNDSVADNEDGRDRKPQADDKSEIEKTLLGFQGDEKAGKLLYIEIEHEEEKPEVVPFKVTNYDKEFTVTRNSVRENIGQVFNQPPILRAEDVGGNFGANLMKNAYNFYNSVTENERLSVERVIAEIFKNYIHINTSDFSISPLTYETEDTLADRVGEKGMSVIISIIENESMDIDNKRAFIKTMFNLSDEEIKSLLP